MAIQQIDAVPAMGKKIIFITGTVLAGDIGCFISGAKSIDGGVFVSGVGQAATAGVATVSGAMTTWQSESGIWVNLQHGTAGSQIAGIIFVGT